MADCREASQRSVLHDELKRVSNVDLFRNHVAVSVGSSIAGRSLQANPAPQKRRYEEMST